MGRRGILILRHETIGMNRPFEQPHAGAQLGYLLLKTDADLTEVKAKLEEYKRLKIDADYMHKLGAS